MLQQPDQMILPSHWRDSFSWEFVEETAKNLG